jgi:hypothetical protein
VLASFLSLSESAPTICPFWFQISISPFSVLSLIIDVLLFFFSVIRQLLIRKNQELDRRELDLQGSGRLRIEEAARLEGITFAEAMERKKGFRYLV